MEFRVLGPVVALSDGRPVPLKERKQRLVLALLLLESNQLVPIDRLVDLLWQHDPPNSARRIVQAYLSRLRTMVERLDRERSRVIRYGSCYMLECEPHQVDVFRFRTLLDEARRIEDDHAKAAILHEAVSLWRGPALADAADDQLRRELCGGLEEARATAVEDRLDARLRLGQHVALLDELTDLHARHPTHTRVAAQLMTALYRSGRSSEALQVHLRTREWLRSELGIDPTADLDRLYTAILRNDPALDVPKPPAEPPPVDATTLATPITPVAPVTPITSIAPITSTNDLGELLQLLDAARHAVTRLAQKGAAQGVDAVEERWGRVEQR
ncbi:AfsR/SARP family transcriptional regulator [Streptomyces sp. WI04-05B]|uniref:AfsR/SARP family transcriptional regulator n=1 Tax=Streptomyces TaxID=1883 RepID=UPI0029B81845|nr:MULTISPECIES: AfsR/SARP family transcriptional regulator [unclassified Streptomyces]MDX2545368.1 AfsR/SARP family transcriptional regulator [Streptomyces sp. WI04-05B]MDX2588137.1 AfsR/SARP family transcriptional regulator [Streptomyces sp. WI04-05A]MDX3749102.1 AfsR/SARP family transcriptional regulator [Streptomyces sp. AK08-02]